MSSRVWRGRLQTPDVRHLVLRPWPPGKITDSWIHSRNKRSQLTFRDFVKRSRLRGVFCWLNLRFCRARLLAIYRRKLAEKSRKTLEYFWVNRSSLSTHNPGQTIEVCCFTQFGSRSIECLKCECFWSDIARRQTCCINKIVKNDTWIIFEEDRVGTSRVNRVYNHGEFIRWIFWT